MQIDSKFKLVTACEYVNITYLKKSLSNNYIVTDIHVHRCSFVANNKYMSK